MDSARYYVALMLVISVPGVYLFWFSVHPFVRFWRKVGPRLTLGIHFLLMILVAAAIFQVRSVVMSVEYGTNWFFVFLAVPLFGLAVALRRKISEQFSPKSLMGLPELAPDEYPRRLVTEGIYSRIRHPRYVQMVLALAAYALFCNYLALYVIVLLALPGIMILAQIEEKELRECFGDEYAQYCGRVPRFIPRF